MKKLRLVLGDQFNSQHSWYAEKNDKTLSHGNTAGDGLKQRFWHKPKPI